MTASGAWADLVPIDAGDRVALPPGLDHAAGRLSDRGARLIRFEPRMATPLVSSPSSARRPVAAVSPEVVVVDGGSPDALARLDRGLAILSDGGRLVVVAPNHRSPLVLLRRSGRQGRGRADREQESNSGDSSGLGLGTALGRLRANPRVAAVSPVRALPRCRLADVGLPHRSAPHRAGRSGGGRGRRR